MPRAEIEQAGTVGSDAAMRRRAGPWIFPGVFRHSRAHGIQVDVSRRVPSVRIVHRAGVRPALPEMTHALMQPMHMLRIEQMRTRQGLRERFLAHRNHHKVYMVGREIGHR